MRQITRQMHFGQGSRSVDATSRSHSRVGRSRFADCRRRGFTIVELIFVIGVMGLLLSLLLPAVQTAREASRRTACFSNLRQISLAVQGYTDVHGWLPYGSLHGFSLFVRILPQLDQGPLFNRIDFAEAEGLYCDINEFLNQTPLAVVHCPSDGSIQLSRGGSSYGGNAGVGVQCDGGYVGVFHPVRGEIQNEYPIQWSDIADGLSQTAEFSEFLATNLERDRLRSVWDVKAPLAECKQRDEFAESCRDLDYSGQIGDRFTKGLHWANGDNMVTLYNHILTPNELSCTIRGWVPGGAATATSNHPGGVCITLCDGSTRFTADSVDLSVWRAMATRSGSEVVSSDW